MKHLFLIMALFWAKSGIAQVSDFEFSIIPPPGYWNGSDQTGGFTSGDAYFPNVFNTAFGGYWQSGFAWSIVNDTLTPGSNNLYASSSGAGHNSQGYAVVQQGAVMRIPGGNRLIQSIHINNGTYAWISMRDGDGFAKKFGGLTGNAPDFFRLLIRGYSGGILVNDSVEFFLADYRFNNNTQDYIVRNFTAVNTSVLGPVDSIKFSLNSSDISVFGMNTPAFFVIDNVLLAPLASLGSETLTSELLPYPNPSEGDVFLDRAEEITLYRILDMSGRCLQAVKCDKLHTIPFRFDAPGSYLIELHRDSEIIRKRIQIQ